MPSWARTLLSKIERGRSLHGTWVGPCGKMRGVLLGEETLRVCAKRGGEQATLFYLTVFPGLQGYRGWVEIHGVVPQALMGGSPLRLYGSWVEDWVLGAVSSALGPGGRLFYEYIGDPLTLPVLERGYPLLSSRMGYRLLKAGFTWLKDLYYAEGFREGAVKLIAEKPMSLEQRRKHLAGHMEELKLFLDKQCSKPKRDSILESACRRARLAMRDLQSMIRAL